MTFLTILKVAVVFIIVILLIPKKEKTGSSVKAMIAEQNFILENADIMSRKVRYETKSFVTRIHQVVHSCFSDYVMIDNLILEDENGVEHQIPSLCATEKGVILFQTVDYPGKGLFGNVNDEYWQIAQSTDVAQEVPNAVILALNNAALIKRITGIDVKPVAVVSRYTPSVKNLLNRDFGRRLFLEENLKEELMDMVNYGCQNYPHEFIVQVKDKFLAINISDEEDEDDEEFDENDFEDYEDCEEDVVEEEIPMDENMETAKA